MIHLLDMDHLVCLLRGGKTSARRRLREQFLSIEHNCRKAKAVGDTIGLSAITVCELEHGAQVSGRYEEEIEAIREVLTPFTTYDFDVVECPRNYGRVRWQLESAGRAIGSEDLFIAAHALALGAVLVTNNEAHFGRVSGLRVENWLKT